MTEESYLRINADGTLHLVNVTSVERNLNNTMLTAFGNKVARVSTNLLEIEGQPFGIAQTHAECIAFTELKGLTLRTRFRMGADKILRPVYMGRGDPSFVEEELSFSPLWKTPPLMRLFYAARVNNWNSSQPSTSYNHSCYLFAFKGKVCFQLPLPNVYDNCDVCTGQFDGMGTSVLSAYKKAYDQFMNATWNADLLDHFRQNGSDVLFQYKPTEKDFEQVLREDNFDWTKYCRKVSTAHTDIIASIL